MDFFLAADLGVFFPLVGAGATMVIGSTLRGVDVSGF
jgi:hypothetical protein